MKRREKHGMTGFQVATHRLSCWHVPLEFYERVTQSFRSVDSEQYLFSCALYLASEDQLKCDGSKKPGLLWRREKAQRDHQTMKVIKCACSMLQKIDVPEKIWNNSMCFVLHVRGCKSWGCHSWFQICRRCMKVFLRCFLGWMQACVPPLFCALQEAFLSPLCPLASIVLRTDSWGTESFCRTRWMQ